ncbi:MAG: M48 family metallopeptidase [Bacteroidia bacterium]
MNNTVTAKYFDGQTSTSKQTTLVFNEMMNEFRLHTANENSFVWLLDDIQYTQYGNLLELRNKKYPGAVLKIEDLVFAERFYETLKQNKRVDVHTRLLKLSFAQITVLAAALLGLVVLAYFYLLPPIAEKSAALLPESIDNQIGNTFMNSFLDGSEIDSTKTKYLEQFAAELDLKNQKPLGFTVVKSSEVNAFALPNGQIVVFSAILDDMKSADELAALLGHEASHINNRHSTKILCRNLAGYMLVSLLLSDVNGIMAVLADNAQQLHTLSYSRGFEQEADEQGLKILIDNGINPNGMVNLFEQLEKEETFSLPKIMSSHPLTKERISNMKKIIDETKYKIKPNNKLASIFERIKE